MTPPHPHWNFFINLVAWPIPKESLSQYFFGLSMVLWGWICGSSVYGKLLQHNKYPEFYKFSALLSRTKRIQKFLCQLKSGVFQCKRQSLWRLSFQESIKLKTYQNNIDCRDELKSRVFSCLMITSEMFSWFALIIFFRSFAWLFAEHLSLNPSPPPSLQSLPLQRVPTL